MASGDNEIFYKKLLWGIVGVFCLLFVIGLNVMHYEDLTLHMPAEKKAVKPQDEYIFSVLFTPFEKADRPRMIFLSDVQNAPYLENVFSFLKKTQPENIVLINCTASDTGLLKRFLSGARLIESECGVQENNMEEILAANYNLVVLVLSKNFVHHAALRAAERAGLRPNIKIAEIKHADKRL